MNFAGAISLSTSARWFVLGAVVLLGVFLRIQQLPDQWLTDDEWHAVHRIVSGQGYWALASQVGAADYSIPLTLLYKFVAEQWGLTELGMRMPMLLAGIVTLAGGAVWVWRHFGFASAYCFGVLMAVSPLMVNFSRLARPYALTCLTSLLALMALCRWTEARHWKYGAAYGVLAVIACWLHLAVAPFVLAPLAVVLCRDIVAAARGGDYRQSVPTGVLAMGVGIGILVLCLRPILLSADSLASRMGADLPTTDTYIGLWHVWIGSNSPVVALLSVVLAVAGLQAFRRRMPTLLWMLAVGCAGVVISIYLSRPAWIHNALTFGRYLLPAQPLFLLLVALGLVRLCAAVPLAPVRRALIAGLPALFLSGTPHQDMLRVPNNFTLHYWYQFDYRKKHNPVRELMKQLDAHPFWDTLAAAPAGQLRIAVAGHGLESFNVPHVRWQLTHRQHVLVAQLESFCNGPPHLAEAPVEKGFRLRNAVTLADPASLLAGGIDYVVFDRKGRINVEQCINRFRSENGPPIIEDSQLVVFHLPDGT